MNKVIFMSLLALMVSGKLNAQNKSDEKKVKSAIETFSQSADQQDVSKMDNILHAEYRTVANRLFGGTDVSVMDKPTYLSMLEEKKIGGDKRDVEIVSVNIVDNNASVVAKFNGKVLKFTSYLHLVKDDKGTWQIINDMPYISKV